MQTKQTVKLGNPLFRGQSVEARNRQAALEAYTDSRSQSVVSRVAQIEVEGLRRRENVQVDEETLQNYAYQDNDTSFQEANFARLNRYISANHNDIYVKALRNKASSLVGENGQNITPRLFTNTSGQGTTSYIGQNAALSSMRGINKQTVASYPSYQSFETMTGGAVVSKRVSVDGLDGGESSFVTAQQAKRMQQQQQAMSMMREPKPLTHAQIQSQAARFALEAQARAQKIAEQQRLLQRPAVGESEDNDQVLMQNSNTCIVSNSPLARAVYESSERLYNEEVGATKDKAETESYGPRTVISVHETAQGHVPEELVEMDYIYSDEEIQAPEFLTESATTVDDGLMANEDLSSLEAQAESEDDSLEQEEDTWTEDLAYEPEAYAVAQQETLVEDNFEPEPSLEQANLVAEQNNQVLEPQVASVASTANSAQPQVENVLQDKTVVQADMLVQESVAESVSEPVAPVRRVRRTVANPAPAEEPAAPTTRRRVVRRRR